MQASACSPQQQHGRFPINPNNLSKETSTGELDVASTSGQTETSENQNSLFFGVTPILLVEKQLVESSILIVLLQLCKLCSILNYCTIAIK